MKATASMDLAAAPAAAAPVRAARQGAHGSGSPDTASFDAVLNDVQGAAGNGTAAEPQASAEPGTGNAVPVADDGAPETPERDGGTDGASLTGPAAQPC